MRSRDKLRGVPLRTTPDEGYEEVRVINNVLRNTRLDALTGFTTAEVVNIVRACCASAWDLTPCDLTPDERARAARTGHLDERAKKRLRERYG